MGKIRKHSFRYKIVAIETNGLRIIDAGQISTNIKNEKKCMQLAADENIYLKTLKTIMQFLCTAIMSIQPFIMSVETTARPLVIYLPVIRRPNKMERTKQL